MTSAAARLASGRSRVRRAQLTVVAVLEMSPPSKPAGDDARVLAQELEGDVAAEAQPHDEHGHEPHLARVEDRERPEGGVGQHGQHDEGEQDELHDGAQLACRPGVRPARGARP